MATGKSASWAHAEQFVDEETLFADPSVLADARDRGAELGVDPVLAGTGTALRLLAAALDARGVVEIGTGSGVSSLYLLSGMNAAGVLTTIDVEVENQRAARLAFDQAGVRPARARTIAGNPRDVIGRLTDHAYDLVTFSAAEEDALDFVDEGLRLLRPGGALAVTNALWHDRVADSNKDDPGTRHVRAVLDALTADTASPSALLPSGDGVCVIFAGR